MKKIIISLFVGVTALTTSAYALASPNIPSYFNGPSVNYITKTSAHVFLALPLSLTDDEKKRVYFEYSETNKVCPAIYPVPESCLPKKTETGKTDVIIASLSPNTSYTVKYKLDNSIACIKAPCPTNDFESLSASFTTEANAKLKDVINKNLGYRTRGDQVISLQTFLIQNGYMHGEATGYFGVVTLKAVKDFQRANAITPTGFVGPLTREALIKVSVVTTNEEAVTFQGVITAVSTGCFSDGECSISVDGKKVITTLGRSQEPVGSIIGNGVGSISDVITKIGHKATVHAKKTTEGYTLYGNIAYYISVD